MQFPIRVRLDLFLFVAQLRQDFLGGNRNVQTQGEGAECGKNVEHVAVANPLPVSFGLHAQPTDEFHQMIVISKP